MKNHTLNTVLLLLGLIFFAACEQDDTDTTKPEIRLLEPADHDTLRIGETISFNAEFSDDTELKSYKIEIHSNFDGHNHEKSASAITEDGHPFSFTGTWVFENNQNEGLVSHEEIMIPLFVDGEPVAHGEYHFGVYLTDAAGNEANAFSEIYLDGDDGHIQE